MSDRQFLVDRLVPSLLALPEIARLPPSAKHLHALLDEYAQGPAAVHAAAAPVEHAAADAWRRAPVGLWPPSAARQSSQGAAASDLALIVSLGDLDARMLAQHVAFVAWDTQRASCRIIELPASAAAVSQLDLVRGSAAVVLTQCTESLLKTLATRVAAQSTTAVLWSNRAMRTLGDGPPAAQLSRWLQSAVVRRAGAVEDIPDRAMQALRLCEALFSPPVDSERLRASLQQFAPQLLAALNRAGAAPPRTLRLYVLGDGRVGKTSLLKALRGLVRSACPVC